MGSGGGWRGHGLGVRSVGAWVVGCERVHGHAVAFGACLEMPSLEWRPGKGRSLDPSVTQHGAGMLFGMAGAWLRPQDAVWDGRPFRTALRWFVKYLSALRFLSDPLSALQSTRRVHYGSTRSGGVGRTQGRVHWCRQRPSSGYLNGLPRHCWRVVALRLVGACNRKGWYSAVRLVTMSSDSSWRHRQVFSVGTR